MQQFEQKVAVVTGAASGIGRAIADRLAAAGMRVALADIEQQALDRAADEMRAAGATVLPVRTDVSRHAEVEALAARALEAFGAVHVVANNAGVCDGLASSWDRTLADWEWVLGVNLWGVIHGIHTFLPLLLRQGTEAHIVNTASVAGLLTRPFLSAYVASKHAVVALSESLHHELTLTGAKVKVSVLCPGFVQTRIMDAARNRPDPGGATPLRPELEYWQRRFAQHVSQGIAPAAVAERVFEAIRDERFYILTHPEMTPAVQSRMEDVLGARNPKFAVSAAE